MHDDHGDQAHRGADELAEAERLLADSESDPSNGAAATAAAVAGLKALLLQWTEEPRGETPTALLSQAARTDETLMKFRPDAEALEAPTGDGRDYEHAKALVDAARALLVPD